MIFSSLTFLIVFLPLVFVLYFGSRKNAWQNVVLMITSLLFYAWGGGSYSVMLVLSILLNFFIGRKVRDKNKIWLTIGIILNLLVLCTFKYADFIVENINLLLGTALPAPNIPLPLGVSFFTFHGISFLTDIYRSEKREPIRLDETTLYVCFFPQLVAGPIIRYHDIIDQIRSRTITLLGMNAGVQRFIIGLFKKVVIANAAGALVDQILFIDPELLSSSAIWLAFIAYSIQIYYDFSGYSDMAIGLGSILGFKIPENFNYPYIARSLQDFWRRWHISLSTWFRDYVYIPLGGSRLGSFRTYINLSIIFLLTGLWHGATWNFVLWGALHGFFMIMERLFLGKVLQKIPAFFGWLYTMLVVLVAWVFFRVESFESAWLYVQLLFEFNSTGISYLDLLDIEKIFIGVIALLFLTPLYPKLIALLEEKSTGAAHVFSFLRMNIVLPLLFIYAVMLLCGSTYNPFIYYRF